MEDCTVMLSVVAACSLLLAIICVVKRKSMYLLLGLIAVWELLSECTIVTSVSDPTEIDPLTPIGKRKDLIARYRQARGRG